MAESPKIIEDPQAISVINKRCVSAMKLMACRPWDMMNKETIKASALVYVVLREAIPETMDGNHLCNDINANTARAFHSIAVKCRGRLSVVVTKRVDAWDGKKL